MWESMRRVVAVFAGWQSGKTEPGPWWLLREMQRRGPGDYGLLAPNSRLLNNKALPALLRAMRKVLGAEEVGFHRSGQILTLTALGAERLWGPGEWGETRILFFHAEYVGAIEAATLKALWIDEPGFIDEEIWEGCQARCGVEEGRILLTGRPVSHNWYVHKIWHAVMNALHRRKANADERIEVINFESIANPGFNKAEFEYQRARMQSWRFDMKYRGIPTKPAGAIYGCFDRETHCIERIPLRGDWQRAAGHDFGNKNMAGVWVFQHPTLKSTTGKPAWVAYSSYLQGDAPIPVHAERFFYGCNPKDLEEDPKTRDPELWRCAKRRNKEGAWEPVAPWAWGGNLTNEDGWRFSYTTQGYPIEEPPEGAVDKGIEAVYGMIATKELLFFDDLGALISDLENYAYEIDDEGNVKLDASGKPVIEQKSKWHRMDCLRALACGITAGVEIKVLRARSNEEDEQEGNHSQRRDEPRGLEAELREAHEARGRESSRVGSREVRSRGRELVRPSRSTRR